MERFDFSKKEDQERFLALDEQAQERLRAEAQESALYETGEFDPDEGIEDLADAEEAVRRTLERGHYPVISVPEEFIEAALKGIQPHTTWAGEAIIAGTLGRKPYEPDGQARRLLRIRVDADQVNPRFTGPDGRFHGIVVLQGPILPEHIQDISQGLDRSHTV